MATYKVIWEERLSVEVEADSVEEAEEIVAMGEFQNDVEQEEVTLQPFAEKVRD